MKKRFILIAIALGFLGCASMGTYSPPMRNTALNDSVAAGIGDEFITKVPLYLTSWDGFLMLVQPGDDAPELNAKEGEEEWMRHGTVRLVPKGTRVKLVYIERGGLGAGLHTIFIIENAPELVAIAGAFEIKYDTRIYDYNRDILIKASDRKIDHVVKNGRKIPVR